MNPLLELMSVLTKQSSTSGTVSSILSPNQVLVATKSGGLKCTMATQTLLKPGDRVAVSGTVIIAKLPDESTIPHIIV